MGFPQTQPTWVVAPAYAPNSVTPDEATMGPATLGITADPSRATLSMRVYDCLGTPAPDVHVDIDPLRQDSHTSVYYPGGLAMSIPAGADAGTNVTGNAIFFNVLAPDAGHVALTVTATPLGLGRVSSRETPGVQLGVNTEVEMPPTP
jgi:hypothetical protein